MSGAKAEAPPKLGYLSGPVDARGIYRSLREGQHTSLFGTSYMRHLMQVCEEQGREAVIVTTHGNEAYDERLGSFTILNRPPPRGRSLHYHWRQALWTRSMLAEMERHGVRTAVMTAAQHYWFVSAPFRKRGMRFINSYHCAIRSMRHNKSGIHELFVRLTSSRHLRHADPTMAIAPVVLGQLACEPGHERRKTWRIVPDYDRAIFARFEPNLIEGDAVEILFAGRVETNKGVFDLLTACERLNAAGARQFRFHIHGEGGALEDLRQRAESSSVADRFIIHGFTAGATLADHYAASHIVVVPTRSDFEEGLAKSVIEGVLTLRPVVTSQVCPAIEVVGDACLEARVDDAGSYADAILRLAEDPGLLAEKVQAARRLREDFFDPPNSYAANLREALKVAEA